MSSVALKRVNGLTTWIVVLTAIVGVVGVASTLVSRLAVDEARDFLADRIDEDDFLEAYAPSLLLGFVQGAAMIALVVLTMVWMYRVASNHRALQRNGTWAPGWAIGGWFLPPGALYIIPYLMFRELWKASDPAVPAGDQRWKENRVSPCGHGVVGAVRAGTDPAGDRPRPLRVQCPHVQRRHRDVGRGTSTSASRSPSSPVSWPPPRRSPTS